MNHDQLDDPDDPDDPDDSDDSDEAEELRELDDSASYVCSSCGEDIVVPIDPTAGADQEYVEDCPVCCCPHLLRVSIERDGTVRLSASAE